MGNFREIEINSKALFGIWLNSDSIVSAELVGESGFDWAVIDWEHGMCGFEGILNKVRVLSHSKTASIVRVPTNDAVYIKKSLDMGASGILVPNINNADEAREAVRAMQYPLDGERGVASSCRAANYGYGFKEYFNKVNNKLLKAVQIETAEAARNLDEIAAVEGVDMLFIGHSDLSASLGIYGDYHNTKIKEIENNLLKVCKRYNKKAGLIARGLEYIPNYLKAGFNFIIVASDTGLLKDGMQTILNDSRNYISEL